MNNTTRITIPAHPDDHEVPASLLHIKLSPGRYATVWGPLARKSMTALLNTLEANRDALLAKPEDFSI